jgi:hypothetical protein
MVTREGRMRQMNINVTVRLESPELMAAILALAEALPQMRLGTFVPCKEAVQAEGLKNEVGQSKRSEEVQAEKLRKEVLETETPKIVQTEISTEQAKTIVIEDVRAKLAALSQAGKQKEVKALINKFGGNKLSEIPEEKYAQLIIESSQLYIESSQLLKASPQLLN